MSRRRCDSRTHWNAHSAHRLSAEKINRFDRNFCIITGNGRERSPPRLHGPAPSPTRLLQHPRAD